MRPEIALIEVAVERGLITAEERDLILAEVGVADMMRRGEW